MLLIKDWGNISMESKKLVRKYFRFNKKLIMLFDNQIDEYFKLSKTYRLDKKYKINDKVYLNNNSLIHGSRIKINELESVSKTGLIAPEFLGTYYKNKKKPFVVEFWRLNEEISLKDYISKYCGVTIDVKDNKGVIRRIITSIKEIDKEIKSLNDYRDYIIYQNQEQRFLPNDYNSNSTMAFIVNVNFENSRLLDNDIFSLSFDEKLLKQIVPKWFYKKYMKNRIFDNYETGRERAIIYGIPSCLIEGILVNREIENDNNSLELIKKYFPECYICNIDGVVIKD